ncbi:unnamed protein product, partial [marine sediment metagenome]
MASRKFGWHSGTLTCQDAKIKGDLYVQDDIVFSDVTAGGLGVTGGIDMQETTSAIGIDMGGTFTTSAINIDGTLSGANNAILISVTPTATFRGLDVNLAPTGNSNDFIYGVESVIQLAGNITGGWTYGGYFEVDCNTYGVAQGAVMGAMSKIILGTGESRWCWGHNIVVDASACSTGSATGVLYGLFVDMNTGAGAFGREHLIHLWQHGSTAADNVIAFEGEAGTGLNFDFGTATLGVGINMGDNCTTAIDIGDCTTGIDFTHVGTATD